MTGVGIGGRERAGRPTGEIVLKVFVRTKRAREELDPAAAVPERVAGLPTDVVEMGDAEPDAAPAPPTGLAENAGPRDRGRYRPLVGGTQLQPDCPAPAPARARSAASSSTRPTPEKVYALTNWHVLDGGTSTPCSAPRRPGSPPRRTAPRSAAQRSSGSRGGGKDPLRDAGIVRLDPGTEWRADILEIGAVKGTHTITLAEAATLKYAVRKRGIKTRLTGVPSRRSTPPCRSAESPTQTSPWWRRTRTRRARAAACCSRAGRLGGGGGQRGEPRSRLHFGRAPAGAHSGRSVSNADRRRAVAQFQAVEGLTLQVATAANPGGHEHRPGAALVTVPPEVVSSLAG